ncbi:MAG: glycine zipper 2TM domain-containing protein [Burkholderiales bacterium]
MKRFLCMLMFAVPLAAIAAPMTNEDVIKMVQGGLGEATVIQAIDSAEPNFDTSADGLVKLKQGGVSDAVIQRIMAKKSGAPAASAQPKAPACPECGTVTGIREIEQPRRVGGGTATGALIGGVLGYAIGGPGNRTAGTVVGAAGGAVVGNVVENKAPEGRTFEIGVLFDDGSSRIIMQQSHASLKQGSRVKLVNGVLTPL